MTINCQKIATKFHRHSVGAPLIFGEASNMAGVVDNGNALLQSHKTYTVSMSLNISIRRTNTELLDAIAFVVIAFVLILVAPNVSAQSQRVLEYEYDAAGNIIRIVPSIVSGPDGPDISNLQVSTFPAPIAISNGGVTTTLFVGTSLIFDTPQTFLLSIEDPSIATLDSNQITLAAGNNLLEIPITGVTQGGTRITIADITGNFSTTLSLFVEVPVSRTGEQFAMDFNGSRPLGVLFSQSPGSVPGQSTVFGGNLGVLFSQPPADPGVGEAISQPVGITPLPLITGNNASQLTVGTTSQFVLTGIGLGAVTNVELSPIDDTTVLSISTSPDGTQLTVQVQIDGVAMTGSREIVLTTISNSSTFENLTDQFIELVN